MAFTPQCSAFGFFRSFSAAYACLVLRRLTHAGDWYNAHTLFLSAQERGCALAAAWLSGYSEDSYFRAKMKILANKISQIVSHFAKHFIYVTVSFKEECNSR